MPSNSQDVVLGPPTASVVCDVSVPNVIIKVETLELAIFDSAGITVDGRIQTNFVNDGNGVQVLGTQQPDIGNAPATLVGLQTAINELLGAMRTHGLIAS